MNIFTKDQVARMRTVLENSPRRKSLLTSPVIHRHDDDVTGDEDDITHEIQIYPNPATDKFYISVDEKFLGYDVNVTAHTLLGRMIFEKTFEITAPELEVAVSETYEKFIILSVEGTGLSHKQLMMID